MEAYLEEYTRDSNVEKYRAVTAGKGIAYLLEHVYGPIYLEQIDAILKTSRSPLRLLEYGCGAGMNLLWLIHALNQKEIEVERAWGTDFSPKMIEAAEREANETLRLDVPTDVRFFQASNETIQADLARGLGIEPRDTSQAFDFILGVNTFRYCWRANAQDETAVQFYNMLRPKGRLVMIDMNQRFPYQLANVRRFWKRFRGEKEELGDSWIEDLQSVFRSEEGLPSFKEYVSPFTRAGFEILRATTFSWISHSSGTVRLALMRLMAPIAHSLVPNRAMRVIVIAEKP